MPQSKILVDTNTYIRLAKTIHPLLFELFGDEEYCLYVLPELNKELQNHRLANKFPWVDSEEYVQNRQHFPTISRKQQKTLVQTFEFVWDHVLTTIPGPSKVDAQYIAYAIELDIPVITDDQDMTELANAFDVDVMSTLQLLRLMVDCNRIEINTVKGLREYWIYIADRPANFNADFSRLFPELL